MKLKKLMMAALAGLTALTASAADSFNWTEYYFLLPTDENSRPYKRYMDEKYGTQWNLNVAYNLWNTEGAMPGVNNHNNLLMASLQLQQRLIQDSVGGATVTSWSYGKNDPDFPKTGTTNNGAGGVMWVDNYCTMNIHGGSYFLDVQTPDNKMTSTGGILALYVADP